MLLRRNVLRRDVGASARTARAMEAAPRIVGTAAATKPLQRHSSWCPSLPLRAFAAQPLTPSSACRQLLPAGEKRNRRSVSLPLTFAMGMTTRAACSPFAPAGRRCPLGQMRGARSESDERLERQAKGKWLPSRLWIGWWRTISRSMTPLEIAAYHQTNPLLPAPRLAPIVRAVLRAG
ncbi:UNVERIFIED_ORG: hypothetical protein GGE53_005432 [Rhizobium etli]